MVFDGNVAADRSVAKGARIALSANQTCLEFTTQITIWGGGGFNPGGRRPLTMAQRSPTQCNKTD